MGDKRLSELFNRMRRHSLLPVGIYLPTWRTSMCIQNTVEWMVFEIHKRFLISHSFFNLSFLLVDAYFELRLLSKPLFCHFILKQKGFWSLHITLTTSWNTVYTNTLQLVSRLATAFRQLQFLLWGICFYEVYICVPWITLKPRPFSDFMSLGVACSQRLQLPVLECEYLCNSVSWQSVLPKLLMCTFLTLHCMCLYSCSCSSRRTRHVKERGLSLLWMTLWINI